MTRLQLDYQVGKPFPWAGAVLLALALLVSSLIGAYYHYVIERTAYWEAKTGRVEKGSESHVSADARTTNDLAMEIRHANEVLNKITLPWNTLFQAVEWSSGKDVALLAMEPDADKHVVKISAEAKNIAAVMSYLRHLEAQDIFSSVYLQSHQVQLRNPEKPVRFTLVASWKVTP